MIERHRLAPEHFDALARGGGGAPVIRALWRAQLSKHLLLLRFLAGTGPGDHHERTRAALSVLAAAHERANQRVADLLSEPLAGQWLATSAQTLRMDLGYLGAVAAVSAVHAGLDVDLTGCVHHGRLMLPTMGSVRLGLPDGTPVGVTVRGRVLEVGAGNGDTVVVPPDPSQETGMWLPLRRLTAEANGLSIDVALDDLDPHRDVYHAPATDRLSKEELASWRRLFEQAWELLSAHARSHAEELAAGLRTIIPLVRPSPGAAMSATVRHAVGACGLNLPSSGADLAVTLVHEFQHSKLSAVLDLVSLYDTATQERYYAPWRTDPRPLGGLLQGVYAFTGVADTWRSLRADPTLHERATRQFARVRLEVDHGLATVERSGRLTRWGEHLAAGLRTTVDSMLNEPLPEADTRHAAEELARHYEAWRLERA